MTTKKKRRYIPCRECLTFPICASFFRECVKEGEFDFSYNMSGSIFSFTIITSRRCTLFDDYVVEETYMGLGRDPEKKHRYRSYKRVKKIMKYLYDRVYNGEEKDKT
jgi:hypothetical protein